IFALGIRHVGETNARRLARHFGTFDAFQTTALAARMPEARGATGNEAWQGLVEVEGIGAVVAPSIAEFFGEPHNIAAVDALLAEVHPAEAEQPSASDPPVLGKTVVF